MINYFRLQISVPTFQRTFYKTMLRSFPFCTKRLMTLVCVIKWSKCTWLPSVRVCPRDQLTGHGSSCVLHPLACPSLSITWAGVQTSWSWWLLSGQVTEGLSGESGLLEWWWEGSMAATIITATPCSRLRGTQERARIKDQAADWIILKGKIHLALCSLSIPPCKAVLITLSVCNLTGPADQYLPFENRSPCQSLHE